MIVSRKAWEKGSRPEHLRPLEKRLFLFACIAHKGRDSWENVVDEVVSQVGYDFTEQHKKAYVSYLRRHEKDDFDRIFPNPHDY